MADELAGLVLAGGKSVRLGRDKAMVEIDGTCLLARSVELLGRICRTVHVSGRDPSACGIVLPPGVGSFPDLIPGLGPMGGIITALTRLGVPCLVISCDLPFLDETTLRRLVQAREERSAGTVMTTFLQPGTGYVESLVAVYEPEALPFLKAAAEKGLLKLSRAVPPERRCHIPYDPDTTTVFFNVNYPADLARLRGMTGSPEA